MAKKKKPVAPIRPVPPRPAPQAVSTPSLQFDRNQPPVPVQTPVRDVVTPVTQSQPNNGLIQFDRRLKWFLGICIGLCLVLTLAKVNYSSITIWNQIIPDGSDPKRGLITGTPHTIRLDEWGILAPVFLSQINQGYPVTNLAIGGQQTPLVMNVPVKHVISLFRPDYWGFFALGPDMGFAFWWNFKFFFTLISLTLFFLVLTKNNFWLSVFGAFWITFSSGMVWWSMFFTFLIGFGALTFVVFMELLYTKRRLPLIWLGIALAYLSTVYAVNLYPAFQIPMAYVLVALIMGYLIQNKLTDVLVNLPLKLAALMAVLGLIGVSGYLYYQDAKPTLDTMTQTVYPGQRVNAGGEGFTTNWFSEYYSWLLSDTKLPQPWFNICEASHFVTFVPIVLLGLAFCFVRTRRVDPLLTASVVVLLVLLSYMEFGWPLPLAKATLLSTSTSARVQLVVGVASVVLTILYLNYLASLKLPVKAVYLFSGIAAAIGLMIYALLVNVTDAAGFFTTSQLIAPTLFFVLVSILLLPDVQFRHRTAAFGGAMVLFLLPNLRVNPIGIGMSPITENVVYKAVREVVQRDPKARWVVFGSQPLAFMTTATGANQLSGLKNQPDLNAMHVLDPTAKRDSVYNRHARPVYVPYIDGRDSVVINPGGAADTYLVGVDPCSPKLKQLGVKYFLFDHAPQPAEVRCLKQVTSLGSLFIYQATN